MSRSANENPNSKGDSDRQPDLTMGASGGAAAELPKASVPSFGCLVFVSSDQGRVQARVANLLRHDGTEITAHADSERQALSQVVQEFKSTVSEILAESREIVWREPLAEKLTNEQKRFLPVHL